MPLIGEWHCPQVVGFWVDDGSEYSMISRVAGARFLLLEQRVFVLCDGRRSFLSGWFLVLFGANLLMGCGAPRFQGSMTGGTGRDGSTSLSIQVPSGTEKGDLLVSILGIKSK